MKVKLTAAQMCALRYAGRGVLFVTPDDAVYATGRSRPFTEQAKKLWHYGLLKKSRPAGACRTLLVPTAAAALVLARDAE